MPFPFYGLGKRIQEYKVAFIRILQDVMVTNILNTFLLGFY